MDKEIIKKHYLKYQRVYTVLSIIIITVLVLIISLIQPFRYRLNKNALVGLNFWLFLFSSIQGVFALFTFTVALIGVWNYISSSMQKAELEIKINGGNDINIAYNIGTVNNTEFIPIFITNKGTKISERDGVFLNIFINKEFDPLLANSLVELNNEIPSGSTAESEYRHIFGFIPQPISPNNGVIKVGDLRIQIPNFPEKEYYGTCRYYIVTPDGNFPKDIVLSPTFFPIENYLEQKITIKKTF